MLSGSPGLHFPLPSQLPLFAKGRDPRRGQCESTFANTRKSHGCHTLLRTLITQTASNSCSCYTLSFPWLPSVAACPESWAAHILSKSTHFSEQMATTCISGWLLTPTWRSHSCHLKLGAQMAPPWKRCPLEGLVSIPEPWEGSARLFLI